MPCFSGPTPTSPWLPLTTPCCFCQSAAEAGPGQPAARDQSKGWQSQSPRVYSGLSLGLQDAHRTSTGQVTKPKREAPVQEVAQAPEETAGSQCQLSPLKSRQQENRRTLDPGRGWPEWQRRGPLTGPQYYTASGAEPQNWCLSCLPPHLHSIRGPLSSSLQDTGPQTTSPAAAPHPSPLATQCGLGGMPLSTALSQALSDRQLQWG